MPLVSIITPVYNVEQYLSGCVHSVLAQSYEDWELLLIDDGSLDDSGTLCDTFAASDDRIKVYHKPNGGLSDARNYGIERAKGKYTYFLDSDDWLATDTLNTLVNLAETKGCEIVQGGLYYTYSNYMLLDERYHKQTSAPIVLNREQAMLQLIRNQEVKSFACGKLYKSDILKKHQFPKSLFFEDCYWQHLVFNEITKFCICPKPFYYYWQRENSISGTFTIKYLDLIKGYAVRLAFIKENYPQFEGEMKRIYRNLAIQTMERAYSNADTDTIKLFEAYMQTQGINYSRMFYRYRAFIQRIWDHFFAKHLTRIVNLQLS